ncbi:MAG: DNA/RNA non-specific endonuclease [Collimonas sp.]
MYLCRIAYGSHYNFKTKTVEYVVEHITKKHLTGKAVRKNNFHEDPEVPAEHRSTLLDYKRGSQIYDRGHMAPAEDFKFSVDAMSESFLLSNMVPQVSGNNRGIWSILEQRVATLTRKLGEVYVISGPIYDKMTDAIGDGVKVPQRFFKVILDASTGDSIAFIIPNQKLVSKTLPKYAVSLKDVEAATGLVLFPDAKNIDKETVGALVLPAISR